MGDICRLSIRRLAFPVPGLQMMSHPDVAGDWIAISPNSPRFGPQPLLSYHNGLLVDAANPNRWVSSLDKVDLARDRDALGAAVGVRPLPAPHAAMNGAHEALPIVHRLIAWRVEAM